MNVYNVKFWRLLPSVLEEISNADYVAIDLEMTGIEPRKAPKPDSMEEVYIKFREASSTFTVLQFGLTSVRHDSRLDNYATRAYTFYVSPMFDGDDMATRALISVVDRTLSVSYKTLLFLREHNIRLEDSVTSGIPYLSREEEEEAINSSYINEQERENIDLQIQDSQTKKFYRDARDKIRAWEADPDRRDHLNISNPHDDHVNRFQVRLVHQLLKNEFHGKYRAIFKEGTFIQVISTNDKADKKYRQSRRNYRIKALNKQRGMRYILEALTGGKFADDVIATIKALGLCEPGVCKQLIDAEQRLRLQQPILVGHNMFLDLCFVYRTFFRPLPDSLNTFGEKIHKLFPRIFDTKVLLCDGTHSMNAVYDLEQMHNEAMKQDYPNIKCIPFANSAYIAHRNTGLEKMGEAHQAGFDSNMTANLFIKKTWQMSGQEQRIKEFPSKSSTVYYRSVCEVPGWDHEFMKKFRNQLRIGTAGAFSLEIDAVQTGVTGLSI